VFETQTELRMPDFNSGLSSGRQADNIGGEWSTGHYLSPWATCDHGTREAGVVAAPRNGKNVVGVAWRANLLTIRTHDSPVALIPNVVAIINGIRQAVKDDARIIMMAFGYPTWIDSLANEIKYEYKRSDVLFVGAAGTGVCPVGTTMFPSRMNEVVSVAGVDKDHRPFPLERAWIESCSGSAVDIAAVIGNGDVETNGRSPDDVITVGGSSVATAIVTGIITLIAAEYPTWNREQIINRLFTSGAGYKDPVVGYGVADAYRAVGGYSRLDIQGPNRPVAPGHTYTLKAVPRGDGPFTYRWSTGETSQSISRIMGEVGSQTTTVTVTDSREGKALSTTHTVKNQQDCSQSLGPTTPSDPNMPTGTTRRECYP
jgi:subtilisin family serine protease